jgi:hypothetical protein
MRKDLNGLCAFKARTVSIAIQFWGIALIVCLLAGASAAQDPLTTLPKAYKLEFENDWVKVTRVHYEPREKLPLHEHTLTASAYVYLNDSGPVIFKHKEYGAVTRPATRAGSFRLYRSVTEHHEVENQADVPSDFLRVEFKTEPINENGLRGRYYREDYAPGENYQKVQFENEQVRITRVVCAAGKSLTVSTSASEPALFVALTPAQFKARRGNGGATSLKLGMGQTMWLDVNQSDRLENIDKALAEMLRFDFKTRRLSKEELEKRKPH